MKNTNGTQLYRICQLEKNYEALDAKIDKILTNDLPHMSRKIDSISAKQNIILTIFVVAIIAVFVDIVTNFL